MPQPWPNPLWAAASDPLLSRCGWQSQAGVPVSILGSRALTPLWQTEAVSAMDVSHLAPHCGPHLPGPHSTAFQTSTPSPPDALRSQELSRVCEILQPRAPPLAGVGGCFMVPPARASTPGPPGSRLSQTCPRHTDQPLQGHPAPTLREETVARSMSGELAIILWAARTPAGDTVLPSRPVLASLSHIPRKESGNPTTQGKTPNIWGCHFLQTPTFIPQTAEG